MLMAIDFCEHLFYNNYTKHLFYRMYATAPKLIKAHNPVSDTKKEKE